MRREISQSRGNRMPLVPCNGCGRSDQPLGSTAHEQVMAVCKEAQFVGVRKATVVRLWICASRLTIFVQPQPGLPAEIQEARIALGVLGDPKRCTNGRSLGYVSDGSVLRRIPTSHGISINGVKHFEADARRFGVCAVLWSDQG